MNLCRLDPYTIIHLTDKMMGISTNSIIDSRRRTKMRSRFIADLSFNFKIAIMKYSHPGSLANAVVVWKMPHSDNEKSPQYQGCMVEVSRDLPTVLSRQATKDAIDSISFSCDANKTHTKALLMAILPRNIIPSLMGGAANESAVLKEAVQIILSADSKEELELLTKMRRLNCREEVALLNVFYARSISVLELENGGGAHHRRHAGPDEHTTVNVSFCPRILSTSHLLDRTKEELEKEGKVEGIDFKTPSKQSMNHAFAANNQFKITSGKNTGLIPFITKLQSRNAHDNSHPCGHYVASFKKMWRHDLSFQHQLIIDYTYVDIDNRVPVMNPVDAILKVGVDNKTSVPVGCIVPLAAVQNQSCRAPMLPHMSLLAGDHGWYCEKIVPSVVQVMNNSPDPGASLFSGGPTGNGRTYIAFHDATLDASSGEFIVHVYNSSNM